MNKTQVITTVHASTIDELLGTFRRKKIAFCLHYIDLWMHFLSSRIIAISQSLKRELIEKGVPEKKIRVVRHGINPTSVNPTEEEIDRVRRTLNLNGRKKIVGTVGRLTRVKNHEMFLRSGKLLAAKHPDLALLIVGDGPLKMDLEALARDLSIAEITVFTGWVREIYPVLHLMDVLAVTSFSEGFGYVLLEGMASAKAIVATAVSEIPFIIDNGKTGILVPPDDIEALAEAIDFFLCDPEKRSDMGESARKDVERRFPLEREVKLTTEIYLSPLSANRSSN
jgi:glycosyltransferase involved in cell wall biosynthesis